ncbi:MAG: winged helix-turn-helix transcriptional regulator [Phycisphaerales bacterium]|jgi:DNA-binding transcriptional ArsR family regulator|nr:winged helix-turn-helix transcriptional regulator [Phycisphaerales bacterium]
MPSVKTIQTVAQTLKLLGDPSRLRILYTLASEREVNVSAICRRLRLPQSTVSRHLSLLRMSGLAENRRSGKEIYYAIVPSRKRSIKALLARLEAI